MDSSEMVVDSPEPSMASHKRDRSESTLFVQQDEDLHPKLESEPKRMKLEANTPLQRDESVADQASQSTVISTPTEQSDASRTSEGIPSACSDTTSASSVTQLHELALQFKNIQLPKNCPRLAAYHPFFEQAEKELPKICDLFTSTYDCLKSGGFSIEDVNNICRELVRYRDARQRYPEIKPVALAGVTGAGKSRTLNSILDQEGMALDSDGAERGTNVTHEYVGSEHGQVERYRVNVVYYSALQLETRIAELVASIYSYLELANSKRNPNEIDQDDESDRRSKYSAAVTWFRTMLCERSEFKTRDDAEEFLERHIIQKTSQADMTDILGKFIQCYKDSRQVVDDIESHAASDEHQLSRTFAQVAKPLGDTRRPHPWPLIRKIEVRVRDNELLRTGAIVADTPGVADSDELVVHNTTMYLQNVGTILLISPLLRTSQLTELDNILKLSLDLGKAENTYLVLTKTDQCGTPKPHQIAQMEPEFQRAYIAADKAIKDLQEEQRCLEARERALISRLHEPNVIPEFTAVRDRISQTPSMIREKQALRDQVYRESRHCGIKEVLKNKFRQLSTSGRGPDLKVIFVSNEIYQNKAHPGRLDPEATGIPSVQRLIYELPALDRFGTLHNIAFNHLAPSFRSIISSLTQSKLERKAEVENVLCVTLNRTPELISAFERSLELVFEEKISEDCTKREQDWRKKAERLVKAWAGYKAVTFTTFCRRGGHWKPSTTEPKIQWNFLITGIYSDDIALALKEFWWGFDRAEINTESSVRDWFDTIEKKLRACPGFMGMSETEQGKKFYEMLHDTRRQMLETVHKDIETLRRRFDKVFNDATSTPGLDDMAKKTYVATIMKPTYDAAALIKSELFTSKTGKTWYKKGVVHKERVAFVQNKLTGQGILPRAVPVKEEEEDEVFDDDDDDDDEATKSETSDEEEAQPSVFQSIFEKVKENFSKILARFAKETSEKLKTASDDILKDFNRRYSVEEDSTSNDPKSKKLLLDAAEHALSSIAEGSFKQKLDECKRWEMDGDLIMQT